MVIIQVNVQLVTTQAVGAAQASPITASPIANLATLPPAMTIHNPCRNVPTATTLTIGTTRMTTMIKELIMENGTRFSLSIINFSWIFAD